MHNHLLSYPSGLTFKLVGNIKTMWCPNCMMVVGATGGCWLAAFYCIIIIIILILILTHSLTHSLTYYNQLQIGSRNMAW